MEKSRAAKREYWQEQLKCWQESGLGQSAFCRERKLDLHRFIYWRKRLRPARPSLHLVELPLQKPAGSLAVVIDGRYRLEIASGFDPVSLNQVLQIISKL